MDHRSESDILENRNQALVKAIAEIEGRLVTSLKLLSSITSLSAVPVEKDLDLNGAAAAILNILLHNLENVDSCSLLIYDPKEGMLKILAAMGQSDILGNYEGPYNHDPAIRMGEGIAGRVFAENTPLFLDKYSPEADSMELAKELHTPESLACLPLSQLTGVVGVIKITFGVAKPFTEIRKRDLLLLSEVVANILQTFILRNEIKESEERKRIIIESSPDVIFSLSIADGSITSLSQAFERITGWTVQEWLGRPFQDLVHPDDIDRALKKIQHLVDGAATKAFELRLKTREGDWTTGEIIGRPEYRNGELHSILGFARDVTDRKKAEEEKERLQAQLQHVQKMEAVGSLASGIAHDFNNILQAISGYIQLMMVQSASITDYRPYLKEVDKAVARASDLVNRLLAFSRKVEPELKPVNLNMEVTQTIQMLSRTIPKMIRLESFLAGDLKLVNGDSNQLDQVIMNLCANARDAMPEGGNLVVETANVMLDHEFCSRHYGTTPGLYVWLSVSDTGCGMDKETITQIFDPFYTTKEIGKGTGLGLASVYGIVKNHRGVITCESTLGKGTTFSVYLPALPATGPVQPVVDRSGRSGLLGNETLLLVDDEEAILDAVQEILELYGYKVKTASTGEEALRIYREEGDNIDLVVMDIGMPGMGGQKAVAELLDYDARVKVVIASGYSSSAAIKGSLGLKDDHYLHKPYQVSDLLKTVRLILDKPKTVH